MAASRTVTSRSQSTSPGGPIVVRVGPGVAVGVGCGLAGGVGATKGGEASSWVPRRTAIERGAVGVWFSVAMIARRGASQPEVAEWLGSRRTAVMMSLLLVAVFYHLKLGMQTVIEDYVHHDGHAAYLRGQVTHVPHPQGVPADS